MAWQGNLITFLRNIELSSSYHGPIRYVPFSNLFSKSLSFWRRVCSDYNCLYSNQTPLPLLCSTLLKARVIVVGGEQNRPAPKDNPCSFFFFFFFGMDLVFLRGLGLVGIFFLEKHHFPFDLQVGPLWGTQGGSWPLLSKS